MDPITVTLAANVMTVLMPYAAMGAQEFVKSAGKDAYEKAKSLMATLKARWAGNDEAIDTVARFEEKPERYQPVLKDILEEKLIQDPDLAAQLATLLNEMGPSLEIIQQMEEGRSQAGYPEGRGHNGSEDRSYWTSPVANRKVALPALTAAIRTCPKRFTSVLSAEQRSWRLRRNRWHRSRCLRRLAAWREARSSG